MNPNYLDFEQPIAELEVKIEELQLVGSDADLNLSSQIEELRGKVVILKFWATYCGWCKKIRPDLIKLDRARDDIAVLAISSQGTGKLRRYLKRHRIGLPVLHDRRSVVRSSISVCV